MRWNRRLCKGLRCCLLPLFGAWAFDASQVTAGSAVPPSPPPLELFHAEDLFGCTWGWWRGLAEAPGVSAETHALIRVLTTVTEMREPRFG